MHESRTHHDVVVGNLVQVGAALSVCKLPDANAVGRVELLHEEAATCLHHLGQLQQTGCGQQALHCLFLQLYATCSSMKINNKLINKIVIKRVEI